MLRIGVDLETVTFECVYEALRECRFCFCLFLMCQMSKKRQYECRDILLSSLESTECL